MSEPTYKSTGKIPKVMSSQVEQVSLTNIVKRLQKEGRLFYTKEAYILKDFYKIMEEVAHEVGKGNRVHVRHLGTLFPRYYRNYFNRKEGEEAKIGTFVKLSRSSLSKNVMKLYGANINFKKLGEIKTGNDSMYLYWKKKKESEM